MGIPNGPYSYIRVCDSLSRGTNGQNKTALNRRHGSHSTVNLITKIVNLVHII